MNDETCDILFISEPNCVSMTIQKDLSVRYKAKFRNYSKDTVAYIRENRPKLVVAYLHNLQPESDIFLTQMLVHLSKDIPIVISGMRSACRKFVNDRFSSVYDFIFTPITIHDYMLALEAIWNRVNGIEPEVKEEKEPEPVEEVRRHILLVDDDAISLRTINNYLRESFKVSVTKSGQGCLDFLKKETPDLILLDYEMPQMNGPQTLEHIRQDKSYDDIPVMFLTGVTDIEAIREAMKLHPQGYILKSTGQKILREKVFLLFDMYDKLGS